MKLKKIMSVLLACLMLSVVLISCGSTDDDVASNTGTSSAGGSERSTSAAESEEKNADSEAQSTDTNSGSSDATIQIFQSKVEITDQLEAMAQEYTELTGVKVEVLGTTGDNYLDSLMGKLTSGQGPTIMNISPGTRAEKFKSYLYDLSDQPYVSDIAENLALTIDGKVVGVPYGVEGYGFIYNKDLVDTSKMTDLESFTDLAQELKGQGINSVQLSDKAYFLIGHIFNIPFAMQEDFQDFLTKLNNGEVKMADTAEFQEWAKFMEVIRETSDNPMGVTYDDQIADFATEKTAMIHQGNWAWGMFEDYDVEFEMSIAPMPVLANDKLAVGMPGAWCINSEADPAAIDAALDFFEWFFTSERGHEYITDEFSFIPALKSVETDELDPLSQTVSEYTNSGKTLPWTYSYWPSGMIENYLVSPTENFFSDSSITAEQFLTDLDAAWAEGAKNVEAE